MSLESLLQEISSINEKYGKCDTISKGEFNIFDILGARKESNHSKFLAELLNPYGFHNKGDLFLRAFLKVAGCEEFSMEGVRVEREVEGEKINIDEKNDEPNKGGRPDIVVFKNSYPKLVIENKIGAGDQPEQLLRYYKKFPDARLIYLTLDGKDASEISTDKKEFPYERLSYERNILGWLEKCKEKCNDNPILEQTLCQYIKIIKQLTNNIRSKEMMDEYYEVITKNSDNLSAAFDIANTNNIYEIKKRMLLNLFSDCIKEKGLTLVKTDQHNSSGCAFYGEFDGTYGWTFYFENKEAWKSFFLSFQIGGKCCKWCYGFYVKDTSSQMYKYLKTKRDYKEYSLDRHFWHRFDSDIEKKFGSEEKDFFVNLIKNKEEAIEAIIEKIDKMLDLIEEFKSGDVIL